MLKLLSVALAFAAAVASHHSKIVGGVEAEKGEFPFIVSLQMGTSHFCGGSLIAPKWVLTAAHCIYSSSLPIRGRVVIGAHSLKDTDVEIHKIKQAIKHPGYGSDGYSFDYALVELVEESAFQPIWLNGREIEMIELDGMISTTAGWGTTAENGGVSQVLMKVDVPIQTQAQCEKAYPGQITDTMICAGLDEGGKDSCQGDSGGPLLVQTELGDPVLVGVVSWGYGCARPNKYGVYSRVNLAIEWIESVIQ